MFHLWCRLHWIALKGLDQLHIGIFFQALEDFSEDNILFISNTHSTSFDYLIYEPLEDHLGRIFVSPITGGEARARDTTAAWVHKTSALFPI